MLWCVLVLTVSVVLERHVVFSLSQEYGDLVGCMFGMMRGLIYQVFVGPLGSWKTLQCDWNILPHHPACLEVGLVG